MIPTDPHDRLLAKAFGDLTRRPFAWCFDEPQEIEQPHDGETYISSWSELLHAMTHGQIGTPPQPLRRYEPQMQQPTQHVRHCDVEGCAVLAPLHDCGMCGCHFCERHIDYQTTWYYDEPVYVCYDCLRGEVDQIY